MTLGWAFVWAFVRAFSGDLNNPTVNIIGQYLVLANIAKLPNIGQSFLAFPITLNFFYNIYYIYNKIASNNKILNSIPSASMERLKDRRNPEIWCYI